MEGRQTRSLRSNLITNGIDKLDNDYVCIYNLLLVSAEKFKVGKWVPPIIVIVIDRYKFNARDY